MVPKRPLTHVTFSQRWRKHSSGHIPLSTSTVAISFSRELAAARYLASSSVVMSFRNQKDSWAVSAQSCKEENSESFAGQHSADSTSFYLLDESSAVPDKIFEVAEGGLSDGEPMIIACGNPTRNTGKFHRITFGNERERWTRFSVDSRNSRLSNKALIAQWAADYGEDSDFFRVRVRGECPRAGTTQFISSDDVAVCRKYKAEGFATLPKIMAVDVARFGDDRSVIGVRQGRKFRILGKYRGVDTVQLTRRVVEAREREEPDALIVDGDGLGAGVVDQLRDRGFSSGLHEFRGSPPADDAAMYFNRRAECWGKMRDWLHAVAELPDDPEIEIDLTSPQYGFSAKQQIQLERKEDLKGRGCASPDLGDVLAMTFSVDVRSRRTPPLQLVYMFPGSENTRWMS